jgi:hypothetical protein
MYINDICNVSDTLELILFADDTFFSHNDLHVLTNPINTELENKVCSFTATRYINHVSLATLV